MCERVIPDIVQSSYGKSAIDKKYNENLHDKVLVILNSTVAHEVLQVRDKLILNKALEIL